MNYLQFRVYRFKLIRRVDTYCVIFLMRLNFILHFVVKMCVIANLAFNNNYSMLVNILYYNNNILYSQYRTKFFIYNCVL